MKQKQFTSRFPWQLVPAEHLIRFKSELPVWATGAIYQCFKDQQEWHKSYITSPKLSVFFPAQDQHIDWGCRYLFRWFNPRLQNYDSWYGSKQSCVIRFLNLLGDLKYGQIANLNFFYILSIKTILLEMTIKFVLLHMLNFHRKLRVFVTADDSRSIPSKSL